MNDDIDRVDPLAELRAHQGGQCAICEEYRDLVVDHDHATMLVRGLLCSRCNTSEGQKNYPWLRAYRENPPAARIGLVVRYGEHKPRRIRPHHQSDQARPVPGLFDKLGQVTNEDIAAAAASLRLVLADFTAPDSDVVMHPGAAARLEGIVIALDVASRMMPSEIEFTAVSSAAVAGAPVED